MNARHQFDSVGVPLVVLGFDRTNHLRSGDVDCVDRVARLASRCEVHPSAGVAPTCFGCLPRVVVSPRPHRDLDEDIVVDPRLAFGWFGDSLPNRLDRGVEALIAVVVVDGIEESLQGRQ